MVQTAESHPSQRAAEWGMADFADNWFFPRSSDRYWTVLVGRAKRWLNSDFNAYLIILKFFFGAK